jgi:hypothetical protein
MADDYTTIARDLVVAYLAKVPLQAEENGTKAGEWIGAIYAATVAKVLEAQKQKR